MSSAGKNREQRYIPALRFRALTRIYDPVIRLTTREATFKRRLLEQADVRARDRVLDLGCGTGTLALLIKRSEPRADVFGLDADADVLERARRKTADAGVEVSFQRGLADDLPHEDGAFDAVVSSLFFHHLTPDVKRRTLTEVARVLRPGGELHVADWGRPTDLLMRVLAVQIPLLDGFEPTRENIAGELPAIFERAGLVNAAEMGGLRTAFGTLAFYRAERPEAPP